MNCFLNHYWQDLTTSYRAMLHSQLLMHEVEPDELGWTVYFMEGVPVEACCQERHIDWQFEGERGCTDALTFSLAMNARALKALNTLLLGLNQIHKAERCKRAYFSLRNFADSQYVDKDEFNQLTEAA